MGRGMRRKILLVGFSVTADKNGYAEVVKKLLTQSDPGLDVDILGVGGVNPLPLTALFDLIDIDSKSYTDVVLEIATSVYGMKIASVEDEILDVLYGILYRLQKSGVRVSFVNLFRDNFDYNYHVFDMLIESIAQRYDIRLLDLGRGLWVARGRDFCRSLLRDTVHTNESGATFQGVAVAGFILDFLLDRKYKNFKFPAPKRDRKAVDVFSMCEATCRFSRSGLICSPGVIEEMQSVDVDIAFSSTIFGFSYISGPRAGEIALDFQDGDRLVVPAFDEFCFYERYNFYRIRKNVPAGTVRVTQLSGIPDISLKKGSRDASPRIGKVLQLHYYN